MLEKKNTYSNADFQGKQLTPLLKCEISFVLDILLYTKLNLKSTYSGKITVNG